LRARGPFVVPSAYHQEQQERKTMLTVRHVEKDGRELIEAVERVWRGPRPGPSEQAQGKALRKAGKVGEAMAVEQFQPVFAGTGAGEHPLEFVCGTLYVMNDVGRTVATYHLG
jgi:hypothetical protein